MCNLSEGIAKYAQKKGMIITLADCVRNGFITLEIAAEFSEQSVEEFLQDVEEYKKEKHDQ